MVAATDRFGALYVRLLQGCSNTIRAPSSLSGLCLPPAWRKAPTAGTEDQELTLPEDVAVWNGPDPPKIQEAWLCPVCGETQRSNPCAVCHTHRVLPTSTAIQNELSWLCQVCGEHPELALALLLSRSPHELSNLDSVLDSGSACHLHPTGHIHSQR